VSGNVEFFVLLFIVDNSVINELDKMVEGELAWEIQV
jgi:hypothetical protein